MKRSTPRYEDTLSFQCVHAGLPKPVQEHRFHPVRRWRFDLAWPDAMLAVEIEGGLFVGGRHNRGRSFINDCEKYNTATLMGWRVLRFFTDSVKSGEALRFIEEAWRTYGSRN